MDALSLANMTNMTPQLTIQTQVYIKIKEKSMTWLHYLEYTSVSQLNINYLNARKVCKQSFPGKTVFIIKHDSFNLGLACGFLEMQEKNIIQGKQRTYQLLY